MSKTLIIIGLYNLALLSVCGYFVFVHGASGWLFALAVLFAWWPGK